MHRGRLLLPLLLVCLALPVRATSYGDFDVTPPPAWTDVAPVDLLRNVPAEDVRWGIYDLLSDHQVRVSDETTHYYRVARKVLSPSGVQNASELGLEFDPAYERIVLHHVAIVRDGQSVDALEPDAVRIIESEDDADEGIYDGRLTLLVFLDDVRPGDVIDYAWSTIGANPLLGGKFVDEFDFSPAVPTARVRHRVVLPSGRPLHHRSSVATLKPVITSAAGFTSLTWEQTEVAPFELDDDTPPWFQPWNTVEVSEYATWTEVVGWALPLFRISEEAEEAVRPLIEKIKREHESDDDRIVAAIRFVQDDVRYLGIEMGRNSHEPRQPDETLSQRWGDCKDKALLLVALLRGLGVPAWPALVNTRMGRALDARLPSPFSFDHVIALASWKGREMWIDGTIADQGGMPGAIDTPTSERALLVREGITGLVKVPQGTIGAIRVEETYSVGKDWKSGTLHVLTRYSGAEADAMRSALAAMSPRDLARERLNIAATAHPGVLAEGAPAVEDDRRANVIVIRERYRVRDLGERWVYRAREVESFTLPPLTVVRTMPLAVDYPLDVTQTVTFILPEAVPFEQTSQVVESPGLKLEYSGDRNGNAIVLRYRLQATADSVAAADVAKHVAMLEEMRHLTVFEVPLSSPLPAGVRKPGWIWAAAAAVLFVGVFAVALLPRKRPQPERHPAALFAPGDAPSSAIRVLDTDELAERARKTSCACGARPRPDGDLQQARYADEDILILTRKCDNCGTEQSLYFAIGEAGAQRSARSA